MSLRVRLHDIVLLIGDSLFIDDGEGLEASGGPPLHLMVLIGSRRELGCNL